MRVVFDTNTVVSALFWHGPPHQAMQAIRAGRAVLLSSEALIAELEDALSKEKFIARFTVLGFSVQEVVALHRDLVKIIDLGRGKTPRFSGRMKAPGLCFMLRLW